MGKPKCTTEAIRDAAKLKSNGATNRDIAAYLGVHEATFYRWLNKPTTDNQRELGKALKKVEAKYKAALRSRIIEASGEKWQAAAWMLERQYPDEYGRVERSKPEDTSSDAVDEFLKAWRDG